MVRASCGRHARAAALLPAVWVASATPEPWLQELAQQSLTHSTSSRSSKLGAPSTRSLNETRVVDTSLDSLAELSLDIYTAPPCGSKNGYGQEMIKDDMGSICVPACPYVGVYQTPCPMSKQHITPRCTDIDEGPSCVLPCSDDKKCPSDMVCSSAKGCVYPKKSCLADPLIGTWQVNDAFGIKDLVVELVVHPPPKDAAPCSNPQATMTFAGTVLTYTLIPTQTVPGQLHIKYDNPTATLEPPYYHEGYYLAKQNVLMEDLNYKSGRKSVDTSGVLFYEPVWHV